jgi:peptidoglycan hydrolase-like protein with peptidoglycan-binding domain
VAKLGTIARDRFNPGLIDGRFGPATEAAVLPFSKVPGC